MLNSVIFLIGNFFCSSIHILDWNWKKLCDLVLVEDLVDLTKKVVVSIITQDCVLL